MVLGLGLSGCASSPARSGDPGAEASQSSTINFNDPAHGVHLEYPANWADQALPASGQVLLILQLPEQTSGFPPTMQLSAQNQGGPLQLGQIEAAVVEHAQNSLADFKLISNTGTTLGNEPARQIIFKGSSNSIPVQNMTVVTLHRGQGYALSFISGPSEFNQRLPAIQKVLDSLIFTK